MVRGLGFIHISKRLNKPRSSAARLARKRGEILTTMLRAQTVVTASQVYPDAYGLGMCMATRIDGAAKTRGNRNA